MELDQEIRLIGSDVAALEARLASVERQKPRKVEVDWIPPQAPTVTLELKVGDSVVSRSSTEDVPPPACLSL